MKRTKPTAETRRFAMHPNLLMDVIRRQAGTLAKSILEGVMNSIDAKASRCDITLDSEQVRISDDGQGIADRTQVEQFFETFGTPHTAAEQKTFGTFRMGRGQVFSYGRNVWRTGPFTMKVDIAGRGLDYTLVEDSAQHVAGCEIEVELYDRLRPSELATTERLVCQWCQYAPITLSWNGKSVSMNPASQKWDHILPEAYVRLTERGSLAIFNLGIHTMELPGYRFGTGGLVVSRRQLKVNFARNDVQDSCPVWKKIVPFVQQKADERIARKPALTDDQRQRMADRILLGELAYEELKRLKLFTAVNGRRLSVEQLCDPRYHRRLTMCAEGDPLGDRLYQCRAAVVLADKSLELFRVTSLSALIEILASRIEGGTLLRQIEIVAFDELSAGIDRTQTILEPQELRPNERLWLEILECCKSQLFLACEPKETTHARWNRGRACWRRIVIGNGPADGWTDGQTYVAIGREFLRTVSLDIDGFVQVGQLLLHEYCHDSSSATQHVHGHEFYELFHDSQPSLGPFVQACLKALPRAATRLQRKLTLKTLVEQDRQFVAEQALEKVASFVNEPKRRPAKKRAKRKEKLPNGLRYPANSHGIKQPLRKEDRH